MRWKVLRTSCEEGCTSLALRSAVSFLMQEVHGWTGCEGQRLDSISLRSRLRGSLKAVACFQVSMALLVLSRVLLIMHSSGFSREKA